MRRVILLPGMDGTGTLFRRFAAHAPAGFRTEVVALPAEPVGYDETAARLAPALELGRGCVLVAESYSGPLAARLAAGRPLDALVLCNSFVSPPRHRALRLFALPLLFHFGAPRVMIRWLLAGPAASEALVEEIRAAIASVPAAVLAARLAEVLGTDASAWLARCPAPLLYLRGTEDHLVSERSLRHVASIRPTETARIPAPHLLLQAAPAQAWEAITRFLDTAAPP